MPDYQPNPEIDAALDRLIAATPAAVALTRTEIAEAIGCSYTYIQYVENRALRKLRREFAKRMDAGEMARHYSNDNDKKHAVPKMFAELAGAFSL